MRGGPLLACALLAACFSKPPNNTGGDAGVDAPSDGPPIDPNGPARIATGGSHGCRIDEDTRVLCWGNHDHRQLGDRSFQNSLVEWSGEAAPAVATPNDVGWTSIAAGEQHTCGVRAGKVYCWGENNFAQSNPANHSANNIPPVEIQLPGTATQVFASRFTSCALTTTNEAYCWGQIDFQVAATKPMAPRRLGTTTFTQIALADDHGCAIETTGQVHCWGEAEQLQTGRTDTNALVPVLFADVGPIASTVPFTSIAAGHEATCGTTAGMLVCWGTVNAGQLGDVIVGPLASRVVDASTTWTRAAVGYNHVCAVKNGDVFCYGDDTSGALGSGQFTSSRTIGMKVDLGTMKVSQIAASVGFTCALSQDGLQTRCWGTNGKGELGNGMASRKLLEPVEARLPAGPVAQLVAGDNHTCALVGAAPHDAYCWGLNTTEQTGAGPGLAKQALPVLASTAKFVQLAAGEKHTCGITSEPGELECWGENEERQLGAALPGERRATLTGSSWTDVSAGSRMSCGVDNGNLFCWGALFGGSSSLMTMLPRVGASNPWLAFSVGSGFGVGVFSNSGAFRLAGYAATAGQRCAAGLHSGDSLDTPEEILSGFVFGTTRPHVSAAQANGAHTCVHHHVIGTPSVTCFGPPALLQVGIGGMFTCGTQNGLSRSVTGNWAPVPAAPYRGMFATGDHTCALEPSGVLRCWGQNTASELAANPNTATPTAVHGTSAWSSIAGGTHHTCGIRADNNRVYCWGENEYGQVGDGSSYEPSPVVSGVYP